VGRAPPGPAGGFEPRSTIHDARCTTSSNCGRAWAHSLGTGRSDITRGRWAAAQGCLTSPRHDVGLEVGCAAVAFWIAWVLLIGVATCVSEDTCTHLIGAAWTVLMAAHPVLVAVCGAMFIVGSWKKQDALKRRAVWVLPVGLAAAWVVFLVLLDPTAAAGVLKDSALTGIPT